jgi:hypothetical protein
MSTVVLLSLLTATAGTATTVALCTSEDDCYLTKDWRCLPTHLSAILQSVLGPAQILVEKEVR